MSDEILDELKAIRETLEKLTEIISLSVGVVPDSAPREYNFRIEDVSTAMKEWRNFQHRNGLGFDPF